MTIVTHPKLTPDVRERFISLARTDAHAARRFLGSALGLKKSQRNDVAARILKEEGVKPGNVARGEGADTQNRETITTRLIGDEFSADVEVSRQQTLEEVIQLCNVDLTKWEPKGFSLTRKKSGFGWNARFSKKDHSTDFSPAIAAFEAASKAHAPKKWAYDKTMSKERDCLYVLNTHDVHFGKLAHPPETGGAPWDTRIADQVFRQIINELMDKAPKDRIEEVIIIVGSDMLQIDNNQSTTTAGTYVDSDTRLAKVFEVAAKAVTDIVEQLASRFKVRVIAIPGNHDSTISFCLGKYVEAWFRTHPNVVIDSSPKSRKYYGYGKTLIGFDHGNDTKLNDLPLILMRENQDTISQYRYQEVLTGDKHHEFVNDIKGVRVRIAPALCPNDRWHSAKGYVGNMRQSQGLLYHRESGLEAVFYSTPLN